VRLCHVLFALLAVAAPLCGQRHKLTINAETPEGQELQGIGQENDAAKKMVLMEAFLQKHPSHDGAGWVMEQLVPAYVKGGQFDKAIEVGEKLLAADPDDVAASHNCLKAAEGKKDPDLVMKWAGITSKAARKAAAAPKPAEEGDVENWKSAVDYAKQVDTYTEYSMYAMALAVPDPDKKIMLYDALVAQNPQSQYLGQMTGPVFLAMRQANQNDKAVAFAEKVLEKDQSNEDMLLTVADNYLNKKVHPEKVIEYSMKLSEIMGAKQKPEGVSDADWDKRKNLLTGLGFWMAGVTYAGANKFKETDELLRKALPLVEDNQALKGQALFYLGLANYKMGQPKGDKKLMAEALKFNTQCAAIKGPFQAQAQKNAAVIRQQYGLR